MFFSLMQIDNLEYLFQFFIQILFQNPPNRPLSLGKEHIGCAQQDMSSTKYQTTKIE